MKLKNKKTGEIGYLYEHSLLQDIIIVYDVKGIVGKYKSISELCEAWEDAPEEPKGYWYINEFGTPTKADFMGRETLYDKCRKNFGNYFETEEETEKAVEKLKAWERLKGNGFKIKGWKFTPDMKQIQGNYVKIEAEIPQILINEKDLDLLFGGEE